MSTALLLSLGAAYAVIFWFTCLRRPQIALALIFALSPFQQDISGGGALKFSIAEVNLLLSLPLVFARAQHLRFGPTLAPALLYVGLGALCSLGQWRDATATCLVQCLIYLVLAPLVFASLARSAEDFRPAFAGFVAVSALLALCVCATRSPYVLGLHKNGVGASIAAGLLIATELAAQPGRRRALWFTALGLLAAGLVLTLSRGAWASAVVGLGVIFTLRRQFGLMVKAGALLAVAAAAMWSALPAQAKEYATGFGEERWNVKLRIQSRDLAWASFQSAPLTGVGMGFRKEYDATNLALLTLAETGLAGAAAFALLHMVAGASLWRTQRRLPRASMEFSTIAIAVALVLGKLTHGMVDHYWSRGTLMAAWGAVGMAAWVAHAQRARKRAAARARQVAPAEEELQPVTATA